MSCQTIAKVLKRSVGHPDAPPITSFQLRYPLQIHAELMTHRVFSRNARSSRAVPTARMIEEVMNDPFVPRYWGANQKGMQAGAEHDAPVFIHQHLPEAMEVGGGERSRRLPASLRAREMNNVEAWLWARDRAVEAAQGFANAGYHKQIANRLLAPFLHIDVVLTTTNLSNWDALRDHEMAEPHIRDLAIAMREAVEEYGEPQQLAHGDWHLPYVDSNTRRTISLEASEADPEATARAVSVTRCAQVSYTPFHEAKLTLAEEIERHDQLVNARPMHASPAEHQATPDTLLPNGSWAHPHLAGNLGPGWIQYRKTLQGESA